MGEAARLVWVRLHDSGEREAAGLVWVRLHGWYGEATS